MRRSSLEPYIYIHLSIHLQYGHCPAWIPIISGQCKPTHHCRLRSMNDDGEVFEYLSACLEEKKSTPNIHLQISASNGLGRRTLFTQDLHYISQETFPTTSTRDLLGAHEQQSSQLPALCNFGPARSNRSLRRRFLRK
jgi:hypothetical protein